MKFFLRNFLYASLINNVLYVFFIKAAIFIDNPLFFVITVNLITAFAITLWKFSVVPKYSSNYF